MPVITLKEAPPVLQAIYAPLKGNRVVKVTVGVNQHGAESYTIYTQDGLANRYAQRNGEWVLTKEWDWRD